MKPEDKRENPGNVYEFTPEGRRRSAAGKTKMTWPSKTSIILGVICLLLFIICIVLMVLLIDASDENKKGDSSDSVCLTEECVTSAARISNNMDHGAQPCNDFYRFACGRWIEDNVIPEGKTRFSFLDQHKEQIERVIQNALEADRDIIDLRSFREAKTFYKSCMNETQIDVFSKADLARSLRDFGELPLITSEWSDQTFNLNAMLIKMTRLQTPPFFDLSVAVDPTDVNKKVLKLDLIRGWYTPKYSDPDEYLRNIKQTAKALIEKITENTYKDYDASQVMELHNKLFNIAHNDSQEPEPDENKKLSTLFNLHTIFPGVVDWKEFVKGVLRRADIAITDYENILVQSPTQIGKVVEVLKSTNNRTLANFMLLNFIFSFFNILGEKYQTLLAVQETERDQGMSHRGARSTFCIGETIQARGYAIASVFIKQKFDSGSRNPILDMTKEIRSAFNDSLKDNDWLLDRGKHAIREKNDNMSVIVGYTSEFDQSRPDTYYKHSFHHNAFFNNSLVFREERFNQTFKQLRSDAGRPVWFGFPFKVFADYRSDVNQLYASTAFLQPPIFNKNYPKYLMYGNLGVWLAMQIVYGFDRSVETNGDEFSRQADAYKLKLKLQCFEDQLENYVNPATDAKLNRTHRAHIAQAYAPVNDGIRLAYKAYKTWQTRQSKDELTLPGLNYTQDQLFFLTLAQLACQKIDKQNAKLAYWPSNNFLINEIYKNIPEFVEAFKCPASSRMNSKNKCAVWGKLPKV